MVRKSSWDGPGGSPCAIPSWISAGSRNRSDVRTWAARPIPGGSTSHPFLAAARKMRYRVLIPRPVRKQLDDLHIYVPKLLLRRVEALQEDPRPKPHPLVPSPAGRGDKPQENAISGSYPIHKDFVKPFREVKQKAAAVRSRPLPVNKPRSTGVGSNIKTPPAASVPTCAATVRLMNGRRIDRSTSSSTHNPALRWTAWRHSRSRSARWAGTRIKWGGSGYGVSWRFAGQQVLVDAKDATFTIWGNHRTGMRR